MRLGGRDLPSAASRWEGRRLAPPPRLPLAARPALHRFGGSPSPEELIIDGGGHDMRFSGYETRGFIKLLFHLLH
ncbi:Hypothetical protein NTJ_16163 [Nesidiocoris tenuis]|uniref:Uncharacterized protein n=1 Tax=Nesidiocoris tenuis TaxID=355587 RepID=A0ABN7BG51_9HEMI|nr:Hypothetical protein NTJ_16163 [Nesidiocoris tenuis]